MEVFDEALALFLDRFRRAYERLVDMNGGPPPKPQVDNSARPVYHIDAPPDPYEAQQAFPDVPH